MCRLLPGLAGSQSALDPAVSAVLWRGPGTLGRLRRSEFPAIELPCSLLTNSPHAPLLCALQPYGSMHTIGGTRQLSFMPVNDLGELTGLCRRSLNPLSARKWLPA